MVAPTLERLKRLLFPLPVPERVLILLTNPRSGSTWLFDALRCHPAIEMHPSAVIFERLHLSGRRYPRDLSDGPHATLRIEIAPQQWALVPCFSIADAGQYVSPEVLAQPYAIEKAHPHFFDHYVRGFVHDLKGLEHKATVKVIYQARDPRSSVVSFLRYKERNPGWNAHISPDEVFDHMARIFESMADTAAAYTGLVIDYSDLTDRFHETLADVFDFLWPEAEHNGRDPDFINLIAAETAWEKRKASGTPFLGGEKGSAAGQLGEYEALFAAHEREIERCYAAYRALLALRERQRGNIIP